MAKRVLITAGGVYGPLDDNKLVGNRVRGIWAARFADHLADEGYEVTFLVPDVNTPTPPGPPHDNLRVVVHKGYWDYSQKCQELAATHDAAVMAAAVVNWIPASPVKGKMATKGYNEGDVINIPFVLAPYVIRRMKAINPKLTLIGCKMLIGSTQDELIEAAYGVLLASKCNVVVANDMANGLKLKQLVYQDRTVVNYDNDFGGFFRAMQESIDDEHYRTDSKYLLHSSVYHKEVFDRIIDQYRERFVPRQAASDKVFGAVAVRVGGMDISHDYVESYLVSPREKGTLFTSEDAVSVDGVLDGVVRTDGKKATLNAPLLIRVLQKYPKATAVLHLHEQLPGVPTVPYAPPGTYRDGERTIPGPVFNIEGHGFIACLDHHLRIQS